MTDFGAQCGAYVKGIAEQPSDTDLMEPKQALDPEGVERYSDSYSVKGPKADNCVNHVTDRECRR